MPWWRGTLEIWLMWRVRFRDPGGVSRAGRWFTGESLSMIPKSGNRFSEKIMRTNKLERDDDSNNRQHALGVRTLAILVGLVAVSLAGCVHSQLEQASNANWTPRDKTLLANPPYAKATIPTAYQRQIVSFHRKEMPGSIVVDTDDRHLYFVLPQGKAIRYGVTVGEDALAWSGVAKVGRMQEWPAWVPTREIKERLGNIPDYVDPGPHNPMGARALYLYQGDKDTLYRIHGTNQPEYIGQAISSGCIRLTNEDVIDLYSRAKIGMPVVVLPARNGLLSSRGAPRIRG
jgi:lipoprotein-anchoring transpeptidase ErfK/SrfK